MIRSKFTVTDGLLLQYNHLAQWKTKLNKKVYLALAEECHQQNLLLGDKDSGYQVFRGQNLTTFIENYKNDHNRRIPVS